MFNKRFIDDLSNRAPHFFLDRIDNVYTSLHSYFYSKILGITKDIHDFSGLILDMNEMIIEINLQEFEGLL